MFTCTTEIDETTTNTVVVEGRPVDPGGEPLCGQVQVTSRVFEACDVSGLDTATVVAGPAAVQGVKTPSTPLAGTGALRLGMLVGLGALLVLFGAAMLTLALRAPRRLAP